MTNDEIVSLADELGIAYINEGNVINFARALLSASIADTAVAMLTDEQRDAVCKEWAHSFVNAYDKPAVLSDVRQWDFKQGFDAARTLAATPAGSGDTAGAKPVAWHIGNPDGTINSIGAVYIRRSLAEKHIASYEGELKAAIVPLYAATPAPSVADAARAKAVASVGAHLWMPSDIPAPTEAPQDFGDRKAYAFKAPGADEHDPWYVVLPNMNALKLGYHADDSIDRQHAEFIAAAINRAIAATPASSVADAPRRFTGEQIAALRVAADALIERYAEPIRAILRDAEVADAAGASEDDALEKIDREKALRVSGHFDIGINNRMAYRDGWNDCVAAIKKESGND